jgi:hypothetical protein
MKKEIIVNKNSFEFFFDENVNMWRLIENPNLIHNISIDIEIDLVNVGSEINWSDVQKFIEFLHENSIFMDECLNDSSSLLHSLFSSIYKKTYDNDFLKNITFTLSGIDFKGYSKNINLSNRFEYDYFFFPIDSKNPSNDIGSFVWRANFRDKLLLGVYCDRI